MPIRSSTRAWGSLTRALHWLSAIVIGFGLVHGYWMANLLQPRQVRLPHYVWHSTIFLYFALLLALRIIWRLADSAPDEPPGAAWEHALARLGHLALYAVMVALVVTGYLNWSAFPARFDPARAEAVRLFVLGLEVPAIHKVRDMAVFRFWEHAHMYLAWGMAALVVLHVAAALRHHFVKGNDVMRRMARGEK